MAAAVMSTAQRQKFKEAQEVDLAYSVPGLGRFRCNVFQQRGTIGLVLRVIPMRHQVDRRTRPAAGAEARSPTRSAASCWSRGRPAAARARRWPRWSTTSTRTRCAHVMTIEDPIEFLHRDNRSIINQREVAVDTRSFAHALRSALRQDPDVILVGEMRDFETIETALLRRGDRPPRLLDAAHARRHRDHQPHHRRLPAAPAEADPPAAGQRAQGGDLAAPDAARRRQGPRAGRRSDDHHAVHPRLHRRQGEDPPDPRRDRRRHVAVRHADVRPVDLRPLRAGHRVATRRRCAGRPTWTSSSCKVQGIAMTSDAARDQMARAAMGGTPDIQRFGQWN